MTVIDGNDHSGQDLGFLQNYMDIYSYEADNIFGEVAHRTVLILYSGLLLADHFSLGDQLWCWRLNMGLACTRQMPTSLY